ncbi:MAG TPA: hypothetical protein VGN00_13760 [Puia sp.]|jgi:hypothetical protein
MAKVRNEKEKAKPLEQIPLFNDEANPPDREDPATTITPERARAILQEYGLNVSQEQAEEILVFLRRLGILTLSQLLKK